MISSVAVLPTTCSDEFELELIGYWDDGQIIYPVDYPPSEANCTPTIPITYELGIQYSAVVFRLSYIGKNSLTLDNISIWQEFTYGGCTWNWTGPNVYKLDHILHSNQSYEFGATGLSLDIHWRNAPILGDLSYQYQGDTVRIRLQAHISPHFTQVKPPSSTPFLTVFSLLIPFLLLTRYFRRRRDEPQPDKR